VLESLLRSTIRYGRLTVHGARADPIVVGDPETGPEVTVRVAGLKAATRLALNPDLALGEAYMDETLTIDGDDVDGLFELIGLNLQNRPAPSSLTRAWSRRRDRRAADQKPEAAARNVAHHYDLSEALYRLFLDPQMQYSCAYFVRPDVSLAEAQRAKMAHIIAKLDVRPNQRVLDIGCGWGGLALEIARTCQARVTGITLSGQQLEVARKRAAQEGLADRVNFELVDYRDVTGSFERIVSVGMFEHVGPKHYRAFFDAVTDRLTPDGAALIHSIGARTDGGGGNAWMRKYIFPGGYIPTLSETLAAVEQTGMWVTDVEVLRLHYAHTLRQWLARVRAQRGVVEAMYDERFFRMWEFYLGSCAMSFRHGDLMVMQVQLAKHIDTLPITRSYMSEAERRLTSAAVTDPAAQATAPAAPARRRARAG
jgi:cyclopropane-fatty-acyl-phospholipid synthase